MIKVYNQNMKVLASQLDMNAEMGLIGSLQVVQDNMCEYFKNLGCDGITMIPICNSFFVVTKTKIIFNKKMKWLDKFNLNSEICSMTRIKLNLGTDIISESGEVCYSCLQEMCPIDATTRAIRMINSTLMPDDIEPSKTTDIVFTKMLFSLEEKDLSFVKVVDVSNIDFYKHTNNVEYVKFMFSTLDLDFVKDYKLVDFEIHYIAESRCGDQLKVYKKIEDNRVLFEIKNEEKVCVKAVLNYMGNV